MDNRFRSNGDVLFTQAVPFYERMYKLKEKVSMQFLVTSVKDIDSIITSFKLLFELWKWTSAYYKQPPKTLSLEVFIDIKKSLGNIKRNMAKFNPKLPEVQDKLQEIVIDLERKQVAINEQIRKCGLEIPLMSKADPHDAVKKGFE